MRIVTHSDLLKAGKDFRAADQEMRAISQLMVRTFDACDMNRLAREMEVAKGRRVRAFAEWQEIYAELPAPRQSTAASTAGWRASPLYDHNRGIMTRDLGRMRGRR
jgi:hypothetical protein